MMYDWLSVTVKVRGLAPRVLLLSTAAHSDSTSYQTWVGQSVATVKRSKFSSPQLAVPLTRRWLTLRPPIRCCSAESRRILPGWPRPRATSRCPPARATRRACSPRRRAAAHVPHTQGIPRSPHALITVPDVPPARPIVAAELVCSRFGEVSPTPNELPGRTALISVLHRVIPHSDMNV